MFSSDDRLDHAYAFIDGIYDAAQEAVAVASAPQVGTNPLLQLMQRMRQMVEQHEVEDDHALHGDGFEISGTAVTKDGKMIPLNSDQLQRLIEQMGKDQPLDDDLAKDILHQAEDEDEDEDA